MPLGQQWGGQQVDPPERWSKAPSPLKGPFVGFLLSVSGLFFCVFFGLSGVVGGCLGLLWGVFWLPLWRHNFPTPGGRIFALWGLVWKHREAGYSNESLVFSVFGKLCRLRVRGFA